MTEPSIFRFPLSLAAASVLLLCVVLLRKSAIARLMTGRLFQVLLITVVSVMLAVEGTWSLGLFRHWTFIACVLLTMLSLGYASADDLKKRTFCAFLSHSGLFLVLAGGLFGSADVVQGNMRAVSTEERMLYDHQSGRVSNLPFGIRLEDFHTDYYKDGTSPRQYTSVLTVDGMSMRTSVNHPCRHKGYRIYQYGFDSEAGEYSVLKVVRNPWLPVVGAGALMLVLAALISLKLTWNSWKILLTALALAVIFAVISVARISFGTLMPALRSLWFVPHLIVYMLAYAIMAISVVTGIVSLFTSKIPSDLSGRLLSTASSLLLIGMICGAVWAQQAWGDYWTWDAKECWAAATWMLTLSASHAGRGCRRTALIMTVTAFLAMQMTWYGVNHLPSSIRSLHTYNQL